MVYKPVHFFFTVQTWNTVVCHLCGKTFNRRGRTTHLRRHVRAGALVARQNWWTNRYEFAIATDDPCEEAQHGTAHTLLAIS